MNTKPLLKRLVSKVYTSLRDYSIYGRRLFRRGDILWHNVMLIGAPRCGTSFIHHYLEQHSQVQKTFKKEICFFNDSFERELKWHGWNLPLIDATPSYLSHAEVAERVKSCFSDMKFMVQLRDPVDRAFSSHAKNTKLGFETLSFEDPLEREDYSVKTQTSLADPALMAKHLKLWVKHFPKDRFHIIKSEDLFNHPEAHFKEILGFIGLPIEGVREFKKVNAATASSSSMKPETRTHLTNYYLGPNEELDDLLNGFSWP